MSSSQRWSVKGARASAVSWPLESELISRRSEEGRHTFADLAKPLVLLSVWVQDRGVHVQKGAVGALPTALQDLSYRLRPQSKHQVEDESFSGCGGSSKMWQAYRRPRRAGSIVMRRSKELPWVLRSRLHLPKAEGRRSVRAGGTCMLFVSHVHAVRATWLTWT